MRGVVVWVLCLASMGWAKRSTSPQRELTPNLAALSTTSNKIFMSFLGGSDNSDEIRFTRQQAWDNWAPKIATSKAPNCMRSRINEQKELAATFCFFEPHPQDSGVSDYAHFDGISPERGQLVEAVKLNKGGDPRKTETIFGHVGSFVTNAFVWGNPAADGYARAQGWLFYPLASPGVGGASNPIMLSRKHIEECAKSPEKCKNIYDTLHIEGGFVIGSTTHSRPEEEIATVEWALIRSKDNSNTNFDLLDQGYFVVNKDIISVDESDPRSKSTLDGPITIADFDVGQHIALWMQLRLSYTNPMLSPEDIETGGYLNITDTFSYRFIGDCKIQCDNGAEADLDHCVCRCPEDSYWTGKFCESCSLTCDHGKVDDKCTKCECEVPWGGAHCDECVRTCKSGRVHPVSCECICDGNWKGENCDVCDVKCENGGVLDQKTCTCTCPTDKGWMGDHCEVCSRQCANGGKLDEKACTCSCTDPWAGTLCQECTRTCYHGARINPQCECFDIKYPWGGQFGEKCMRRCQHGGTLHKSQAHEEPCTCECTEPWVGEECEKCSKTCSALSSVSTTPNSDCSCTCKNYWQGRFCDYCPIFHTMKHGGTINADCTSSCPDPWAGPDCNVCNLQCQNGGVVQSPTDAQPERCECLCPAGFAGRVCESCTVSSCGAYSVWAGENPTQHSCDCRSNGQCTNHADNNDRWCNTCSYTCSGSVNTHKEAPWPTLKSGTKECYCTCNNNEIVGDRCEIDKRNKAVGYGSRAIAVAHSPGYFTYSTCTSCDDCYKYYNDCVGGWESYCCFWFFGCRRHCNRWNSCIRRQSTRHDNDHRCSFGEKSCNNPVGSDGCCQHYTYRDSPRFKHHEGNCPTNGDTYPASKVLSGSCSITGSASDAWFRLDMGDTFPINQVTVNRDNHGPDSASVYISTSTSSWGTKCGSVGKTTQTIRCSSVVNGRYIWVKVDSTGEMKMCSLQANYVP